MVDKYAHYFSLLSDILYLNHAAISPWPIRTQKAVQDFATDNAEFGSFHYFDWVEKENKLRAKLAELIHIKDSDNIALVKNTSEGLSMVALGYPWKSGENVVIPANEFPSNRIVWQALAAKGVEIREVNTFPSATPEESLFEAIDKKTRIISVSSVHFAHGLKLDLRRIGEFCKKNDILFCVDAIQSIGAVNIDAEAIYADFIIADGHKWMLGPEGLALFYSRPEARDKLELHEFGWHMIEKPHEFDQPEWQIANSAKRFECGSPNMLCTHALYESVNLILDIGINTIEQRILENTTFMHEYLSTSKKLSCASSREKGRFAGIVTFTHEKIPSQELYQYLMDNKVMCANRGNAIRFSPHFYTEQKVIERAFNLAEHA